MPQYTWITYAQSRQALAARLSNSSLWTDAECGVYLIEALRTWNSLTEQWKSTFSIPLTSSSAIWQNTGSLSGSPRQQTVTDVNLYTTMQYHLLEPPTGGTWSGTSQFSLSDLQNALQQRRDEVLQLTGCNLSNFSLTSTPGVRRRNFPDTTLEPRRIRFIPVPGSPVTLTREDTQAFDYFSPAHLQTNQMPQSWSISSEPPLAMDVDFGPNTAGSFDVIAVVSGPTFNPPGGTLLGLPDDWNWLPKWGALADILGKESEATDRSRAAYCLKRFTEGLKIMRESNWLSQATYNGVPADTPSLFEQDWASPEWQNNQNVWPAVVNAGIDFIAACPVVTSGNASLGLTVVGNAPVPSLDGDFVQVSRDVFDVVLSYAQHLATFKLGGEEFQSTQNLLDDFYRAAQETNKRLSLIGLYTDQINDQGKREDKEQPRW